MIGACGQGGLLALQRRKERWGVGCGAGVLRPCRSAQMCAGRVVARADGRGGLRVLSRLLGGTDGCTVAPFAELGKQGVILGWKVRFSFGLEWRETSDTSKGQARSRLGRRI